MAQGRAVDAGHAHRRGAAAEDEAVDRLAGQVLRLRKLARETPLPTCEHGVVRREPQAARELHELGPAARAGGADEAEELGLGAIRTQHTVPPLEVGHAALHASGQLHEAAPVHAHAGGVMVGGHAHRCGVRRPAGGSPGCGLRCGDLAEELIGLVAQVREQLALAVDLHAGVLEVVADLELVRKHDRRQVVLAPAHVPVAAAQCLRGLAQDVLEERCNVRLRGGGRGLDLLADVSHELEAGGKGGLGVALRHGCQRLLQLLCEDAAAPLLLRPQGRVGLAGHLGDDVLDRHGLAPVRLVPGGKGDVAGGRDLHGEDDVLALPKLQRAQWDAIKVGLVLNCPAAKHDRVQQLKTLVWLLDREIHLLRHGRQKLAHHVNERCADEAGVRDEGVGALARIGQVNKEAAVQVVTKPKGVD
mmetsp:Transcript_4938/g.15543  ORF Transcript_4938/g.15543 Transcript_4938/m.15543 type:complete len:417 (-) Transcript_4938:637-1887(-)